MFPGCTSSVAIVTVSSVTKLMWFLYEAKIGAGELMHEGSTPTFAYCKTLRMEAGIPLGTVWLKRSRIKADVVTGRPAA